MNRIEEKFLDIKQRGKKGVIPFITCGDPDIDTTSELVVALEAAGADIIELGIPYSDPLADGPIIQAASARALQNGLKIINIMEMVRKLRSKTNVPLVFMVYYNSVYKYGIEKFLKEASEAGIDGLIIPDLPLEERGEILNTANKYDVFLIPLVAPTSGERIKNITKNGNGFVYCVSVNGVTGVRNNIQTNIEEYMNLVKSYTNMPRAIGFGISNGETAGKFAYYCDAVIIGSAVIKAIQSEKTKENKINAAVKFIIDIRQSVDKVMF